MARSRFGQPAAVRPLKTYGYPKKTPMGWALADGNGNIIGRGSQTGCTGASSWSLVWHRSPEMKQNAGPSA
jgi:hypothetical protein